jgi:PhnB protein
MVVGVTPYLPIGATTGGARKAIAWYKLVLGAEVKGVFTEGEKTGHSAEISIAGTPIIVADQMEGFNKSPDMVGDTSVGLHIEYPSGSKEVYDKAIKEGAKVRMEYKDQPWGYLSGVVEDPFGYRWSIAEDVKHWSYEEIAKNISMSRVTGES